MLTVASLTFQHFGETGMKIWLHTFVLFFRRTECKSNVCMNLTTDV